MNTIASRWAEHIGGQKFGYLWASTALLGLIAILLTQSDRPARLVLPVLIMLGYAYVTYKQIARSEPALRSARLVQLADSLYFLGFLWTLCALISSLVFTNIRDAESVFHVFGYSLVTTATGMFLRLFLLQFKYSAQDQAAEAQLTVEEQLEKFCTHLNQTSATLEAFGAIAIDTLPKYKNLTQRLGGNLSAINNRTGELEEAIKNIHKESLTQIHESIQKSLETLIRELRLPMGELHQANRHLIDNIHSAEAQLTQRITENVALTEKTLATARTNFSDAFLAFAQKLGGAGDRVLADLEALASRVNQIKIPTDVSANTDNLMTTIRNIEATLSELLKGLTTAPQITSVLESLSVKLKSATQDIQREVDSFSNRLRQITAPTDVTASFEKMTAAARSLEATFNKLGKELESTSGSVEPQQLSFADRLLAVFGRR